MKKLFLVSVLSILIHHSMISQVEKLYGFNQSVIYSLELLTGNIDTLGVFDEITEISGHSYDSDNERLFLLSEKVNVIDIENAEITNQFIFPVVEIEYDRNEGRLLGYNQSTIYSLNLDTGAIDTVGVYEQITGISGHTYDSNNGYFILLSGYDVYIINPANGNLIDQFNFPVVEVEYDETTEKLIGYNESSLYSLDMITGEIDSVAINNQITSITGHTYNQNNGYFIILSNKKVYIVNSENGFLVNQLPFDVVEIEYSNNNLSIPTSIENHLIDQRNIDIFPNPTRDRIKLSSLTNTAVDVTIFSTKGVLIRDYEKVKEIDLTVLSPGSYYLLIKTDKHYEHKLIVKIE